MGIVTPDLIPTPPQRSEDMSTYTKEEDWSLVVACLSPTKGPFTLAPEVDLSARLLCDGMGKLSEADIDPSDGYPATDWSHVRDSSDEAIAACAAYLREAR